MKKDLQIRRIAKILTKEKANQEMTTSNVFVEVDTIEAPIAIIIMEGIIVVDDLVVDRIGGTTIRNIRRITIIMAIPIITIRTLDSMVATTMAEDVETIMEDADTTIIIVTTIAEDVVIMQMVDATLVAITIMVTTINKMVDKTITTMSNLSHITIINLPITIEM